MSNSEKRNLIQTILFTGIITDKLAIYWKITFMTKTEALKALSESHKLSHRYFNPGEWMIEKDGLYEFEDGCQSNIDEFWYIRQEEYWDIGWYLYNSKTENNSKESI